MTRDSNLQNWVIVRVDVSHNVRPHVAHVGASVSVNAYASVSASVSACASASACACSCAQCVIIY